MWTQHNCLPVYITEILFLYLYLSFLNETYLWIVLGKGIEAIKDTRSSHGHFDAGIPLTWQPIDFF
jgi:hypothetical protein